MTPSLLFGPFWRCYPGSLVRCLPLLDCRFTCSLNMLSFTSRLHTACDYGLQNVIQHRRVVAGNPVNVREPVQYWSYWSSRKTSITISSPNPGALCLTPFGPFFYWVRPVNGTPKPHTCSARRLFAAACLSRLPLGYLEARRAAGATYVDDSDYRSCLTELLDLGAYPIVNSRGPAGAL